VATPHALGIKPLYIILTFSCLSFCLPFWGMQQFVAGNTFFYDKNFAMRAPQPSDQIVLIFLDEHSRKHHRQQYTAWRPSITQAIKRLCAAEVDMIGLDIVFQSATETTVDQALAHAIDDCGNVVLARTQQGGEILPLFQAVMLGDGLIDLPQDASQVLRHVEYRFIQLQPDQSIEVLPSFALEMVRGFYDLAFTFEANAEGLRLGAPPEKTIQLPRQLNVQYWGDYRRFDHYTISDLLAGRIATSALQGKLVLIGTNQVLSRDFFVTPYARFNHPSGLVADEVAIQATEPGVAIHAHVIQTLLDQDFLVALSQPYHVLLCLMILSLGLLFYSGWLRLRVELLLAVAGVGLILCLSYALFAFNVAIETATLLLIWASQFVLGLSWQKYVESNQQRFVTDLLGKNVSPQVAKAMIADVDTVVSGQRQEVTLFFSDIRGFTSISEQLEPDETSQLLNHYFTQMLPLINQFNGTVDKLMGDGIMAFYGAPIAQAQHADCAADTALQMIQTMGQLRQHPIKGCSQIRIGIGLNTGPAIIGILGSQDFWDYTAIGDSVNLASRLEGVNKVYGTQIILSAATRAQLSTRFVVRELDYVVVKGKATPVTIYELLGYQGEVDMAQVTDLEQAIGLFREKRLDAAKQVFLALQQRYPQDGPCAFYLRKIDAIERHGLHTWEAVTRPDK